MIEPGRSISFNSKQSQKAKSPIDLVIESTLLDLMKAPYNHEKKFLYFLGCSFLLIFY